MRVVRRRSAVLVAAGAAFVVAVSGGPAQAVGSFSPRVTISTTCAHAYSATTSTGTTRGAMDCRTSTTARRIQLFSGSGLSWTRTDTGVNGRVLAFADDGTRSWVMYAPVAMDGRVFLLRRDRTSGAQSIITLSSSTTDVFAIEGALVAAGGRYWAAWSVTNGAWTSGRTFTRQTMYASYPASLAAVTGQAPSLTRVGTANVMMVLQESGLQGGGPIVRYLPKPGGVWGRVVLRADSAFEPDVLYVNGVTYLAWREIVAENTYRIVFQGNASGTFVRRTLPGDAAGGGEVEVFLTGGRPTVAWTGHTAGQPSTSTYVRVAQRVSNVWSTTSFSDGTLNTAMAGAGGWSGKAIVVMTKFDRADGVSSRRQP